MNIVFGSDWEFSNYIIKTNPDFQEGLISKLGADNFLKAKKYLNGTPYENVMRNSLSAASQNSGSVMRHDRSIWFVNSMANRAKSRF